MFGPIASNGFGFLPARGGGKPGGGRYRARAHAPSLTLPRKRGRGIALAFATAGIALLPLGRPASAAPEYVVEQCCDLCPLASNRAAYTTRFLQSFTTLVQGEDGWLFRTEDDLVMNFGPDEDGYRDLKRLRDALKRRGVELVMVYQPPRGLMHTDKLPDSVREWYNADLARMSYTTALQRFRDAGIVVPDLPKLIHNKGEHDFYFRGDHHWTPHGARRAAEVVAAAIRELPAYADIPKKEFTTSRSGMLAKRGTLQKAATRICGFGYPEQQVVQFATAAEGELFGDAELPQVTLVGTSNSDEAYNFGGFLSEMLGVDILNESIGGGGFQGALQRYLPSDNFQKSAPKILIWELASYHNLSKDSFYRQIVPLVNNGCRGRKPVLTGRAVLEGERTEILFNGAGEVLTLKGRDHLIDLQFNNPNVREMTATIWYTNGSDKTTNIKNSEHVDAQGRFVFELNDDDDWGDRVFMSMDLALPPSVPPGVEVSAQLCERV